jgi:hypothetical protein
MDRQRLREAYENRKKKEAPKQKWTARDFVSLTVSVIALIISGGSVYFTLLRQIDDVSMVVGGMPMADWVDGKALSIEANEFNVTFMNTGTRSVVVNWLAVDYAQPIYDDEGCARHATSFTTDLQPLVIKEKEIVVKKIKIADASHGLFGINAERLSSNKYTFKLLDHNRGKDTVRTEICITVSLTTPSRDHYLAKHSMWFTYASEKGADAGTVHVDTLGPKKLIWESGTIFDW